MNRTRSFSRTLFSSPCIFWKNYLLVLKQTDIICRFNKLLTWKLSALKLAMTQGVCVFAVICRFE